MGQEEILLYLYEKNYTATTQQYCRTKELSSALYKRGTSFHPRNLRALWTWNFVQQNFDKGKWLDEYRLTPNGVKYAETLLNKTTSLQLCISKEQHQENS